jgi:hypothetical protein
MHHVLYLLKLPFLEVNFSDLKIIGLSIQASRKLLKVYGKNQSGLAIVPPSFLQSYKNVRRGLKHWSRGISKLKLMIENSNTILLQLDSLEEKRSLFIQERNFGVILKRHINRMLDYQNKYWKKVYLSLGTGW